MKKLILLICLIPLFNLGCGGDDTPEPTEETLNKELLYDKLWIDETGTVDHDFKSNGNYGVLGTWEWINNSDTLVVHEKATKKDFYWIINKGNTATRMETRPPGTEFWSEFRTSW